MKTWGYGGASNQKWVFQTDTPWGAAGGYRTNSRQDVNCLGYALEINDWIEVYMSYGDSVETVYSQVAWKVSNIYGRQCRRMTAKDDYLRSNEYKIAMRVGSHKRKSETSGYDLEYLDYHFMVQVIGRISRAAVHPNF